MPDEPLFVRVDSFGLSFAVEKVLLARGFDDARGAGCSVIAPRAIDALVEDRGRILAPRQHHFGVERALGDLERVFAAKPQWRVLNPPAAVRELFDKRITSRRYAEMGVPVPRPVGLEDVPRAFVKLSSGSSASCLGIWERDAGAFTTTMERARGGRLYNSRRLRRYTGEAAQELVAFLEREGAVVEEAIAKAKLGGEFFDCRVLVIAGDPAFTIVRKSPHEITNLHLGGTRGDPDELARVCPREVLDAAYASCRRVFDAHGAFHVGVDLLFEEGFTGHRVVEANAFGDLFPNLPRDGVSVYEWEVRALERLDSTGSRRGMRSSTPPSNTE